MLLLLFTHPTSSVGYLGALDRATHILVSELCTSGSRALAVDQVCGYWRQLCEAEAQAAASSAPTDATETRETTAELAARAARAASEFYSAAAMHADWMPSPLPNESPASDDSKGVEFVT